MKFKSLFSFSFFFLFLFISSCISIDVDTDSEFLDAIPVPEPYIGNIKNTIEVSDISFDIPIGQKITTYQDGVSRDNYYGDWTGGRNFPANLLYFTVQNEFSTLGYPIYNPIYSLPHLKNEKPRFSVKMVINDLIVDELYTNYFYLDFFYILPILVYIDTRETSASMAGDFIIWDNLYNEEIMVKDISISIDTNNRPIRDVRARLFEKFVRTALADSEIYNILNNKNKDIPRNNQTLSMLLNQEESNQNLTSHISTLLEGVALVAHENSHTSGFFITESGYMLSAYPLTFEMDQLTVLDSQFNMYDAKVVATDISANICLIKADLKGIKAKPLPLRKSNPIVGETVYLAGYPSSKHSSYIISSGIVSKIKNVKLAMDFIQVDASCNELQFGGPMLDSFGNVIGVTRYKTVSDYSKIENISTGVPIKLILETFNIVDGEEEVAQ